MLDPTVLGPLNGFMLAASLLLAAALVIRALSRVNRGEVVDALPLTMALVVPLGFAVWAANGQLASGIAWAIGHGEPAPRQTLMALMIQRSLLTQLFGGLGIAALSALLLLGAIWLTVPGERPRLALGQAALVVGGCVVLAALVGLSVQPTVLLAVRAALYLAATLAVVTALMGAHRRGPGVQLGTLAAVSFPILVAAADQATLAWYTGIQLQAVALAEPALKQALLDETLSALGTLRAFSAVHLGLAAGLALLGPLAAWQREQRLARRNLMALATVVVVASVGVGWASTWLRTAGF